MAIVDTTVWIDFFGGVVNPETTWLREQAGRVSPGLTDLILCEVLQGIRDDFTFARVRLRELVRLSPSEVSLGDWWKWPTSRFRSGSVSDSAICRSLNSLKIPGPSAGIGGTPSLGYATSETVTTSISSATSDDLKKIKELIETLGKKHGS